MSPPSMHYFLSLGGTPIEVLPGSWRTAYPLQWGHLPFRPGMPVASV